MNYREALDYIYGHTNYEAVPKPHAEGNYDLRRLFEILSRLGNPHLKARSLHITGTNGKGSTSVMLASVLTEAGFRTGLYTSPHLITTRERFTINGQMISEAELADLMTRLQPEVELTNQRATYGKLTVFEILTVLCFMYFAEQACDFQVMEVGMGGRYDATNVIQPEVCFLTSISFDHTAILGNTLTQIATEKCGIIKPGCVVVSHPQLEEASRVIERTCLEKGVPLIRIGKDVTRESLTFNHDHQEIQIRGRLGSYRVSIPLLGHYQLDNAAAAVAGLEVLIEKGYQISNENILQGLAKVSFPGRLQIASKKPLILLDGGHNPGAARNLRESIQQYFRTDEAILVIGIASDKDIPGIIRELAPVFKKVITTRSNSPRAASPDFLKKEFQTYGIQADTTNNVAEALEEAKKRVTGDELICVTGSLYVVGEALAQIKGYAGAD